MIEKTVDIVWAKTMSENQSHISKNQCKNLVKVVFEKANMENYFNDQAFEKIYNLADPENKGVPKRVIVLMIKNIIMDCE